MTGDKIFLDGVLLQHCMSADIEKGFATCHVLAACGGYKIDPGTRRYVTEDHYGEIRIEPITCDYNQDDLMANHPDIIQPICPTCKRSCALDTMEQYYCGFCEIWVDFQPLLGELVLRFPMADIQLVIVDDIYCGQVLIDYLIENIISNGNYKQQLLDVLNRDPAAYIHQGIDA